MKLYYELLGLSLDEVKQYFESQNIKYAITLLQGRKDKDKLICPRVIKITPKKDNSVELCVTYFSDSLI